MQQAQDFLCESRLLNDLLTQLKTFQQPTSFKQWSINHILRHLYTWNRAVEWAITDTRKFAHFAESAAVAAISGQLRSFEHKLYPELIADTLQQQWWQSCLSIAELCSQLEPKQRVPWIGPSMSARSAITARLMETWSHAQAIYDVQQEPRQQHDYIKNIAFLGINTFGWSFKVNQLAIPEVMPRVILTAPSGEIWQWGQPDTKQSIQGKAVEFCQVVTQTRNISDTELEVKGDIAEKWMQIAQCFAGRAETPPAKGQRLTHEG